MIVLQHLPIRAISATALLLLSSWFNCDGEDIPGLQVKAAILTSGIDEEKNYIEPGRPPGTIVKNGPVFLWTVLTGSDETLAALKRRKSKGLPVRHRWTYIGPTGRAANDADVSDQDTEEIKVGRIQRWPALAYEVAANGVFDWRTWSGKRHLRPGRYEIRVLSPTGQLLQCGGTSCVYYFDYVP